MLSQPWRALLQISSVLVITDTGPTFPDMASAGMCTWVSVILFCLEEHLVQIYFGYTHHKKRHRGGSQGIIS